MRKCIRCGTEMKENCAIKVEFSMYGIVISTNENKMFGERIGIPKVAIKRYCSKASNADSELDIHKGAKSDESEKL